MKFSKILKKNKFKILYSIILVLTFSLFLFIVVINYELRSFITEAKVKEVPFSSSNQAYPTLKNNSAPFITAQGVVIMDKDSQVVLYEKNQNLRFSPASTTKIMSALVSLEYFDADDILTVQDSSVDGSSLGLVVGEQLRFEDLLYAMMLPSANDAAKTIADNYPGGVSAFVERMNTRAIELGLNNTHFADPSGLQDDKDYTTPIDLARLASHAKNNPDFGKVVSTKNKTIKNTWGVEYRLDNLNILLNLPGVNGIKTGFTEEAGEVLVTSKKLLG